MLVYPRWRRRPGACGRARSLRAVAPQLQPRVRGVAGQPILPRWRPFSCPTRPHSKTPTASCQSLEQQGRELLRRLYQAHLWLRAPGEAAVAVRDSQAQVRQPSRRHSKRGLETVFGDFRVGGSAMGERGCRACTRWMRTEGLPPELYSHQVRRRASEEAAEGSFDKVVEALSKTTGAQVGKRQVQELVGRAAQDFDAF